MSELRDTVRLHHSTVSNYQQYLPPRRRLTRSQIDDLLYIKVHPLVWKKAVKLCGGDMTRIKVRSATEVSVLNPSKRK